MSKVSVVGAGFVGSTAAYAMFIQKVASEIAIIDRLAEKAEGHAMDLEHGMMFTSRTKITYGKSYTLCKGSDVVVVTLGIPQQKGQSRLECIRENAKLFKEVIPEIYKNAPDAVLIIVSNPVDALTYLALKYSKYKPHQVFGTGTALDTARFRYLLGEYYKVDPKSVHAYVMGEHGESAFPVWSCANIGGINLQDLPDFDSLKVCTLFDKTRNAAHEIIVRKGATYYAIGLVISELVHAILTDRKAVFPVSTLLHDYHGVSNVCLSVPCVIGKGGIIRQLKVPLDAGEKASLRRSADVIMGALKGVN